MKREMKKKLKTTMLEEVSKTIDSIKEDSFTGTASSTLQVQSQIEKKYQTLVRWNDRESFNKKKKESFFRFDSPEHTNANEHIIAAMMRDIRRKAHPKLKHKVIVEELSGIKALRRQRFKKSGDPLQMIQHYISKENFKATEEEDFLIGKIVKLKQKFQAIQHLDLNFMLSRIYKIMNSAVDLNETRILILLIVLAAEICYEAKDMHRAFYFYNQARIASTYANQLESKLECLMQMGKITLEYQGYRESFKIFMKALEYAWKLKDEDTELIIYDFIGKVYFYQGNVRKADYYHNRSSQGTLEANSSAIKRISEELLLQYDKKIKKEPNNLSQLFIQYLNLPISNFNRVSQVKLKKDYPNYKNGQSPRKNRQNRNFEEDDFLKIELQIKNLFQRDEQFFTEIPEPNIERVFSAQSKFGRHKKNVPFEHTTFYHQIVKREPPSFKSVSEYSLPLDQKIEKRLSEKSNPRWWQDMVYKTKTLKEEKVGKLRDRIRKSHESYHKYPQQRRKLQSRKTSKIGESINKALLDLIDPVK